ncbi:MAG TPA: penicillin-binding protein 1C [Thermoanaerobaculia bacterium]|nr:penicillin-binding protein 1C [Thermoanaerobaculia bacterium]
MRIKAEVRRQKAEGSSARTKRCAILLTSAFCLLLSTFIADVVFPPPIHALRPPPATVIYDREGRELRIVLPRDEKYRIPVTLDEVPPELIAALVASEDRWYYRHPGVNPLAVVRASWTNLRARGVVSGASTIPMQIARMAEPKRRSLRSKGIEAFRALQLSRRYSKRELLEIYINIAPYGRNIEGIGAASYFYFGKKPSQLSLGEIALLTTLPRSPNRYDPLRDPKQARAARDEVLRQLGSRGAFPPAEIEKALLQPIPTRLQRTPFTAPHFTDLAVARGGGAPRLFTTLDQGLQKIAERQVAARIGSLRTFGIENAAVVVIENESRTVRALVGSADFFDRRFDGQVNGAFARRSPGSTLKPFLYAKAFDEGHLLPDSYLLDIPTDFSGYVAENYDGTYRGRLTVRESLVLSLNASAVRLLARVGLDDFLGVLRKGGLSTLDRRPGSYGLSLILGAGEVTLLDLTNFYSTLAEGGVHRPAQMFRGPAPEGERIFSAEASQMITEILCEVKRPDLPQTWDLTREAPTVAWKTGTSYGHRDAWSVGFSKRYTIGVWVGNFDGRGQKGISGSEHAAPLLFDLFRTIEGRAARPDTKYADIERVDVCALSHELPGPDCAKTIAIPYIPERTQLRRCTYHRRILVDRTTRERLAGECVATRPHEPEISVVYPAELVAYWHAQGQAVEGMPPLSAACSEVAADEAPRIVSPDATTPYRIRGDAPIDYQEILLQAQVPAEVNRLYWYVDGTLIASLPPTRRAFVRPARGTHRVVVVDDIGRSDSVTYEVE